MPLERRARLAVAFELTLFPSRFASSALFFTASFLKQLEMWLRTVACGKFSVAEIAE